MSSPESAAPVSSAQQPDAVTRLRSDFLSAFGWIGLGMAILIGSVRMDRLENQDINPYTIPGLLPGLLGIAMTILGVLLAARNWRSGLLARPVMASGSNNRAGRKRLLLVLALCLGFGVLLVGHGLPFWLASAIFVTAAILSLQYQQPSSTGQRSIMRRSIVAASIGLGAGIVITLIFQELFLVRLP